LKRLHHILVKKYVK